MDVLREVPGSARGKERVSLGLSVDLEEPLSYSQYWCRVYKKMMLLLTLRTVIKLER